MNNDLKNILSNSNKDIDKQRLMDYLSNELSKAESNEVESTMASDPVVNDAVEGLQQVESKKDMPAYMEQMNRDLAKQLAKNRARKDKRRLKGQAYTYLTILVILILVIVSFLILKKSLD